MDALFVTQQASDGTSAYARVLERGVDLVRGMGDTVPFEATSKVEYTKVWEFLEQIGTGKSDSPLLCKITYRPIDGSSMRLEVTSAKLDDGDSPRSLLLYDDNGVHRRVPAISFDMAVLVVQLIVTMIVAVLDVNDKARSESTTEDDKEEMRDIVVGKMRELDEMCLEEDLALVMATPTNKPGARKDLTPADDDYDDDDDDEGFLPDDHEPPEYDVDLDDLEGTEALARGVAASGVAADIGSYTDIQAFKNASTETKNALDSSSKALADLEDLKKLVVELQDMILAAPQSGGGSGRRRRSKSSVNRRQQQQQHGGGSPQDDAIKDKAKDLFNRAANELQMDTATTPLSADDLDSIGEGVEAIREVLDRKLLVAARAAYSDMLDYLEVVSNVGTAAASIRDKADAPNERHLYVRQSEEGEGDLEKFNLEFEPAPSPEDQRKQTGAIKEMPTAGGRTVKLEDMRSIAIALLTMPKISVAEPDDEDSDGPARPGGKKTVEGLPDLAPSRPMMIDEFITATRATLDRQTYWSVCVCMTAVKMKLDEISDNKDMKKLLYLMGVAKNRELINKELVSTRLLTFVKLNFRGGEADAVDSLFRDIHTDTITAPPGGEADDVRHSIVRFKHVAHDKPYIMGPFNAVIPIEESRKVTATKWAKDYNMFDAIRNNNDVIILGYGASGAGKTSFLIAITGTGAKAFDNVPDKFEKTAGVLSFLIKEIAEGLEGVDKFTVRIHQAMSEDIKKQTATGRPDAKCNTDKSGTMHCISLSLNFTKDKDTGLKYGKRVEDDPTKIEYGLEKKVLNDEALIEFQNFLDNYISQPTQRDTWATQNNSDSSRTHCIVHIEFGDENNNKYGRLILGDLAGFENRFDCRLKSMKNFRMDQYLQKYRIDLPKNVGHRNIWDIEESTRKLRGVSTPHFPYNKAESPTTGDMDKLAKFMVVKDTDEDKIIEPTAEEHEEIGKILAAVNNMGKMFSFDGEHKQNSKNQAAEDAIKAFCDETGDLFEGNNFKKGEELAKAVAYLPVSLLGGADQLTQPRPSADQNDMDILFKTYLDDKYKISQAEIAPYIHDGEDLYGNCKVTPNDLWSELKKNREGTRAVLEGNRVDIKVAKAFWNAIPTGAQNAILQTKTMIETWVHNVTVGKLRPRWTKDGVVDDKDPTQVKLVHFGFETEEYDQYDAPNTRKMLTVLNKTIELYDAYSGTLVGKDSMKTLLGEKTTVMKFKVQPYSLVQIFDVFFNNKTTTEWPTIANGPGRGFKWVDGPIVKPTYMASKTLTDTLDRDHKGYPEGKKQQYLVYDTGNEGHKIGLDAIDFISDHMTKDNQGLRAYPSGIYFILKMIVDASRDTNTIEKSIPDFPPDIVQIQNLFRKCVFPKMNEGKTFDEGMMPKERKLGDTTGIFARYSNAAKVTMIVYSNAWRLRSELIGRSILVSLHCQDRDNEAKYIISTLRGLTAFIRENIFKKTGVSYPPIEPVCLAPMLRSLRYKEAKMRMQELEERSNAATLDWLGLDGEPRGSDFIFCLAGVVDVAPVNNEKQKSLTKYVDVSDVKDAMYKGSVSDLILTLQDLVGWRGPKNGESGPNAAYGRITAVMDAAKSVWGGKVGWDVYDTTKTADAQETVPAELGMLRNAVAAARTIAGLNGDAVGMIDKKHKDAINKQGAIQSKDNPLNRDTLLELTEKFTAYVDADNASTALGVLEFMDNMAKFDAINIPCHGDDSDADKRFKPITGNSGSSGSSSSSTSAPSTPTQSPGFMNMFKQKPSGTP